MDFYDREGRATHYTNEDGVLYSWGGQAVGKLRGENLYTNGGRQIGRVKDGWLRDLNGHAVAFSSDRKGAGPLSPIKQVPAIKSTPSTPPIPAIPATPQTPANPTFNWSTHSIDDLLK